MLVLRWMETDRREGGSAKEKKEKSLHSSLSRRLLEKRKKKETAINGMTNLFACYLRGGTSSYGGYKDV